jgi:hypothetical protein
VSVLVVRTVCCDGTLGADPCPEWFGQEATSATVVRRYARQHGWTVRRENGRTFDRCPACTRAE